MKRFSLILLFFINFIGNIDCASGGSSKGTYQVLDSVTHIPCITLQADIYLYLTYYTTDGESDVTVHIPTTSTVDSSVSSCDTIVSTSGLSIKSQLLRILPYHMDGWSIDFAFTKDNTFRTDNEKQYALFQVNITANFASDPTSFPNAKDSTQHYYVHIDPNDISDISTSIYATSGNAYYCPSKQKYAINKDSKYGPYAYILLQTTTLQAYQTGVSFGQKETCSSDQSVTDMIPIIVGSCLAGLIIITLAVYLIYRSCLPEDVINLVNPESHYNYENAIKIDDEDDIAHIEL
ncbi:unnamed protein product [Caenorhabditis angaria]|uniref:Uncharacterized protein n=1 Tax=Caenorhabditis angaria TaxID=860376 RepID=A0A9P1J2S9_9PELO|nr:unnamed protein product [Caenorhabditis angaria]